MPTKHRYITRFKGSPFWYTNFTINGKRIRTSTGQRSAFEAERIALTYREKLLNPETQAKSITIGEAVILHLETLEKPHAIADYHSFSKQIVKYFGFKTPIKKIQNSNVVQFIAHLRQPMGSSNRVRSNATINRYLSCLSAILKTAGKHGANVDHLKPHGHKLQEADHRIRYLSTAESERLIEHAADHLKPIIRFALMTGLRKANILALRWDQIDFQNNLIKFYVKSDRLGGKLHMVPLYPDLRGFLLSLEPHISGFVFTYKDQPVLDVKKAFAGACRRAGVKDFRFHDLRHTCASWLVQSGVELSIIKELLGHENIKTTLKYAHLSKQIISDEVQKVIGKKMAKSEVLSDE